ncbi:biotin apo-protein ligase [Ascobolus immersus RN42]|uniref:Biotin apo-protein ligase n=1 Tax=Ascobolus immersus RN42 TaxID=1160509 RepID=A0A3N4I003_ASCIM|nr:biotin apo-protein ligase [Ascobolus immersus RN42]
MSPQLMNILIYNGDGCTPASVRNAYLTLSSLLTPHYAISTINASGILTEPWQPSCALLVFPGGADLGYCRSLNGLGISRIKNWVLSGGKYLGFCAGAYFASEKVEFEVGKGPMEVVGRRELALYPGICRGTAFPGFMYGSEAGARAVALKTCEDEEVLSYYNGGGLFVDADGKDDVEILARYEEPVQVEGGDAAIVYVKYGLGGAVLSCPHPEFAPENLERPSSETPYSKMIDNLLAAAPARIDFTRFLLKKLGLTISDGKTAPPPLSALHFSSMYPEDLNYIIQGLNEVITQDTPDAQKKLNLEHDEFILYEADPKPGVTFQSLTFDHTPLSLNTLQSSRIPAVFREKDKGIDKVVWPVLTYHNSHPDKSRTPHFNHAAFYATLDHIRSLSRYAPSLFGQHILYGQTVTSTNTILEQNFGLISRLPSGVTAVATHQTAGRGRGQNAWISPEGALIFSVFIRHGLQGTGGGAGSKGVVFLQYIAALAICRAITTSAKAYAQVPVKIKWPNDIYLAPPHAPPTKLAGILVNSSFANNTFLLTLGIGINLSNPHPTTSLNNYCAASLPQLPHPAFTHEAFLAKLLVTLEETYLEFVRNGWSGSIEKDYYRFWMHQGQEVALEDDVVEKGINRTLRGHVEGVDSESGMLVVRGIKGTRWEVRSDGNSFDFMRGLVRKKVN